MSRKIDSEIAAWVLEAIGRPDAAALIVSAVRGTANESCCEHRGFPRADLDNRAGETGRPAVLALRVGLEPTILR